MRDLIILFVDLITTVLRIARPGGVRSVIAESVLIKHQLLIVNRSRRRAPNLPTLDDVRAQSRQSRHRLRFLRRRDGDIPVGVGVRHHGSRNEAHSSL
jgi:hypothetical protein